MILAASFLVVMPVQGSDSDHPLPYPRSPIRNATFEILFGVFLGPHFEPREE